MRALVQRVSQAQVSVDGVTTARIGNGFLVLLGISRRDTEAEAHWLADKVGRLRVFSDAEGKMSLAAAEVDASVLVVSQFTLYGTVRRGLRPDFGEAAPGSQARTLYEAFCQRVRETGLLVETGVFGAHMAVTLTNDGPVTIYIDTDEVMPNGLRRFPNGEGNA